MAEDVDYCKLFRSWLTGEEHALLPSSESRNKKWQKGARLSNLVIPPHSSLLCAARFTCYSSLDDNGDSLPVRHRDRDP